MTYFICLRPTIYSINSVGFRQKVCTHYKEIIKWMKRLDVYLLDYLHNVQNVNIAYL